MMTTLRKYFIAGLLAWPPLVATVVIIKFVIDILDRAILLLSPEYRPEALPGFSISGILMIPKEAVTELNVTVEDGFKFVISMGVIVPGGQIKQALPATVVARSPAAS